MLVAIGAPFICCFGLIAYPNMIRSTPRPSYYAAKLDLQSAYAAERSYFLRHSRYEESVETIGFFPKPGRYRFVFSKTDDAKFVTDPADGGLHTGLLADEKEFSSANNALLWGGIPSSLRNSAGISGTCPSCEITIIMSGNLDSDSKVDVWSISTAARTIDGEAVPAGLAFRHVNDSDY
jgi:hypothetical protein